MQQHRQGGFLITKIHHLAGRIFSRMLKEHQIDIHPGQGRILFALWGSDEVPIKEIAKRTLLSKSTLTDLIDRLEQSGYIVRVPNREDRRKTLIKLTEKNKALQETYTEVSQEMLDIFYSGFTPEEIDTFETLLKRTLANLQGYTGR